MWWMAWIALMLVVFALPSLAARLLMLPGDSVQIDILENKEVDAAALDLLQKSRESVVGWFAPATVSGDLAVLSLERARLAEGDEKDFHFRDAEKWQKMGLVNAPADSYGWFRMAFLLHRLGEPAAKVARAWELSLSAAPFEPRLALARLQMGMQVSLFLNEDAGKQMGALIRYLAQMDPDVLAASAVGGAFTSAVEEELARDEALLAGFRESLSHVQPLPAEKKKK
jgi:hypothetical protein